MSALCPPNVHLGAVGSRDRFGANRNAYGHRARRDHMCITGDAHSVTRSSGTAPCWEIFPGAFWEHCIAHVWVFIWAQNSSRACAQTTNKTEEPPLPYKTTPRSCWGTRKPNKLFCFFVFLFHKHMSRYRQLWHRRKCHVYTNLYGRKNGRWGARTQGPGFRSTMALTELTYNKS